MSETQIKSKLDKRSIIVVGKTGAGKSKLLNDLLCDIDEDAIFTSSADIKSCTDKVKSSEFIKVKYMSEEKESKDYEFELKGIDTPGIGDSQGRSREFLNDIAQTIRETPLNMIIILVEFGKIDTGLYNNLEILRESLNDLSQSSSMLIINKVPTKKYLDNKRKKREIVPDKETMLAEAFQKLSTALGSSFKYQLFLENDDDDVEINAKKYNFIKQIIHSCGSLMNVSQIKTWNEIFATYSAEISRLSDQEVNDQMNKLKAELKDKLDKIEFDIADIKYPFLDYISRLDARNGSLDRRIFSNLLELRSRVETEFDCSITEEAYMERKNVSTFYIIKRVVRNSITPNNVSNVIGVTAGYLKENIAKISSVVVAAVTADTTTAAAVATTAATVSMPVAIGFAAVYSSFLIGFAGTMYFFYKENQDIIEKLNELDQRRKTVTSELSECEGSIEEQKTMLKEKRDKIIRLENALVNPIQSQA